MKILFLTVLMCVAVHAAENVDPRFASATKIVLSSIDHDGVRPVTNSVTVTNAAAVRALTMSVHLKSKPKCKCSHRLTARFITPKQQTLVWFCDHCFDFDGRTFDMPTGFYERALKVLGIKEAKRKF